MDDFVILHVSYVFNFVFTMIGSFILTTTTKYPSYTILANYLVIAVICILVVISDTVSDMITE